MFHSKLEKKRLFTGRRVKCLDSKKNVGRKMFLSSLQNLYSFFFFFFLNSQFLEVFIDSEHSMHSQVEKERNVYKKCGRVPWFSSSISLCVWLGPLLSMSFPQTQLFYWHPHCHQSKGHTGEWCEAHHHGWSRPSHFYRP